MSKESFRFVALLVLGVGLAACNNDPENPVQPGSTLDASKPPTDSGAADTSTETDSGDQTDGEATDGEATDGQATDAGKDSSSDAGSDAADAAG